jgi:ribosomal-protein-alanine N-acetyltransferase
MQPADLDAVMAIEKRAYHFPWTRGIFQDCLRVGYSCWIYAQEEQVLGYAVMSMAVGEGHILNLCIAPDYQGRGHGRRLLRALLAQADAHGVGEIYLEARPSNISALRLYLSEGFNEIGSRRDYYPALTGREDAVVLARTMASD